MSADGLPISNEEIASRDFLTRLAEALHEWTVSLYDPATGGFRQNAQLGANIMTSTDVAWMRYAIDDPETGAPDRDSFIAYLENAQEPSTGMVHHARGPAGQGHCDGHAFWHTVRALNILGGRLRRFPRHLQSVLAPHGLADWFDGFDWDSGGDGHHHNVLGLVPVLVSLDNAEWTDVFFTKIAQQRDESTGCWPRGEANISRTFAYTALHLAGGRMPDRPGMIVDAMLDMQEETGLWERTMPGFHTMDATFLLARLPRLIGHREAEALTALRLIAGRIREVFIAFRRQLTDNPHKMLAMTHTLGLLQEAFPDEFPSRRPFRFDWDKLQYYHCPVISQAARDRS